jgi:hypothetical protein
MRLSGFVKGFFGLAVCDLDRDPRSGSMTNDHEPLGG